MSDGTDIMSSVPREPVRGNGLIYVLVTPARNEALFIEDTIRSVIAQTNRPLRWVIVSDGSTDETDEIVRRYTKDNSWIEFVRMPARRERHFAGKVHAFNAGYARLQRLSFAVEIRRAGSKIGALFGGQAGSRGLMVLRRIAQPEMGG